MKGGEEDLGSVSGKHNDSVYPLGADSHVPAVALSPHGCCRGAALAPAARRELKQPSENREKKYLADPLSKRSEGNRSLQVRFPSRRLGAKQEGMRGEHRPQPLRPLGPAARGERRDPTPPLLSHSGSSAQALPPCYTAVPVKATHPGALVGCRSLPGHSSPQALLLSTHCWHFQVN